MDQNFLSLTKNVASTTAKISAELQNFETFLTQKIRTEISNLKAKLLQNMTETSNLCLKIFTDEKLIVKGKSNATLDAYAKLGDFLKHSSIENFD